MYMIVASLSILFARGGNLFSGGMLFCCETSTVPVDLVQ